MRRSWLSTSYLTNEKGVTDIIVYAWGIAISLCVFVLFFISSSFVRQALEVQRIAGGELRDSMRIHNGLTPGTQSFIIRELERRGFDGDKITVTGTPAGANFGTELTASVSYVYDFPIISMLDSAFPNLIGYRPIIIRSEQHAYALGVVR